MSRIFRPRMAWLPALLACGGLGAQVATFDAAQNLVTLPSVDVGGVTYQPVTLRHQGNFVFTLQDALREDTAAPGSARYDLASGVLHIPAVRVGVTTYLDVELRNTGNFSFALQAARELPAATLAAVQAFVAAYDATWASAPPVDGQARVAHFDACYLGDGRTRARVAADTDADLATYRAAEAYQVGRQTRNLQVLAVRERTNADGSARQEIDLQYDIAYADGSVQAARLNTLISGSSAGTPACVQAQAGTALRFFGNQQQLQVQVRARNQRDQRRGLSNGAALAPAVNYRRSVSFGINDPQNLATYAVVSGPGPSVVVDGVTVPFSLKFIAPRLLRDAPELQGKNGNYLNWLDDDGWRYCRVDGGTLPVASRADCVGQGATSYEWGVTTANPNASADQSFDAQGWVLGGSYRFDIYADDGWKTVNGHAGKTPIATYWTTLDALPYTFVEMAGGSSGDKFPRMGFGALSFGQVASNAAQATPQALGVNWTSLAGLSDHRAFRLAQAWEFNSGPKAGNASGVGFPAYRNLGAFYPASTASSVAAWPTQPLTSGQARKSYFEYTLLYSDRGNAQILSTLSFQ